MVLDTIAGVLSENGVLGCLCKNVKAILLEK